MTRPVIALNQDKPNLTAIVMRDGRLMVSSGGTTAEDFFAQHPIFADHARKLLLSGRTSVRYSYIDADAEWFMVAIDALPGANGESLGRVHVLRTTAPFGLTLRELDVLTLLAAGHSNQDIGDCLDIRLRTVTTHVERILLKLGRLSRTAAATLAVDFGLLRLPTPGGGRNLQPLTVGLLDAVLKDDTGVEAPTGGAPRNRVSRPDPLVIGTPLSLRGLAAADAREMMMSARMAVREINAAGGVLGRPLELHEFDCDIGDAASVTAAVRGLIDQGVHAVASGYSAGELAVQDLMAEYGAPYLHCATMEALVERVRNEPDRLSNIFQICPSDVSYGPRFIQFLDQLEDSGQWKTGNRRITIIQPRWLQMDIGLQRVEQMAQRRGLQIDLISDLPPRNIDWGSVIRRVNDHDPCAVLLAYYFPEENIAFLRHYLADPGNALIYTLYGPSVPAYREELGAAAEGVIWATTTGRFANTRTDGFLQRFRQMHGRDPGHSHAGLSYDRIHLLARAWASAGDPTAFARVNEVLRTQPYRGVNGMYFMDNSGQSVTAPDLNSVDPSLSHPHLIFQIQQGRQVLLAPSMDSTISFRPPPWLARRAGSFSRA